MPVTHHHLSSSWRLSLILIIYIILATFYSVVTPIGRGADEWAHYWYAGFIASHGRLPANLAEREAAGYKSDWPPLYHFMAAALTAWIDTEGPPTFKYREGHIRRQLVPAFGPEAILHTEDEGFPWQQEILVWHLGRFLSIGLSAGALLVTYKVALEVFESISPASRKESFALAAVACLAFNPRFLFTSMLFNYDSLTMLLAALFLWLCIRVAKDRYSPGGFWGLGLLAGLALLTKYLTALLPLILIPVAMGQVAQWQNLPASFRRRRVIGLLGQAALVYLMVVSLWFGYLIANFNEVESYGPVLGILAPLIRGDGSDRTIEGIFAWLSGGQAPTPAPLEKPYYTPWQIMAELPVTFWGNPVIRPYPLNWFVIVMTGALLLAALGLIIAWRAPAKDGWMRSPVAWLLFLFCLLPLPFMVIRLFGARDPLEAVQGRHILFLAGPAVAILFVYGLHVSVLRIAYCVSRVAYYTLLALLLTGAVSQLILLYRAYPPPLPVRTTPYPLVHSWSEPVSLPGGARLIDLRLSDPGETALQVSLIWQGGPEPAPEDYQTELALVDAGGRTWSTWRAYQTQARYPTRSWEAGDTIRDDGWLPLTGVPAGDYTLQLRLLDHGGEVIVEQSLTSYSLTQPVAGVENSPVLWQAGVPSPPAPLLRERETIQVTFESGQPIPQVVGPDGLAREPVGAGDRWANFIVGPDWPAGAYRLSGGEEGVNSFRVAENDRTFQIPTIAFPLEANFAGKIKLLGYDLPSRRVKAGEGLPLTLYWQGMEWLGEEFVIFIRLLDNQQVAWGGYDRLAKENYSTLLWAPGEIIVDGFAIPIAADAPDGVYTLNLGWYQKVEGEAQPLPLLDLATGQPTGLTSVMLPPVKIGGPPPDVMVTEAIPELEVVLGEQIKLLGFDLKAETVGEWPVEQPVPLTLYWQPVVDPPADYTVFVHLRHREGELVIQADSPPAQGRYPTSLWQTDEIIKDELALPAVTLEAGRYELVVGMYNFATGERLPVQGSPDGTILLQAFEVEE